MTELEKELTIKVKRLEDDCKAYNFTQHTLQEKIKQLEEEKDKAWWEGFDTCKAKAGEANVKLSDEINLLKAQIEKVKHYLDYDIPHDLINEATTKIWRMLK